MFKRAKMNKKRKTIYFFFQSFEKLIILTNENLKYMYVMVVFCFMDENNSVHNMQQIWELLFGI